LDVSLSALNLVLNQNPSFPHALAGIQKMFGLDLRWKQIRGNS
jgi:hypothetical protein